MLEGLWHINITDAHGMSAVGLVLLQNGVVLRGEESINIAGTYEEQENALLATIEVLLCASSMGGGGRFIYVCLHVQGQLAGHTISATGVDLSDAWHRVDVRLVRRALVARHPGSVKTLATQASAMDELSSEPAAANSFAVTTAGEPGASRAGATAILSNGNVARSFAQGRGRSVRASRADAKPAKCIAIFRMHTSDNSEASGAFPW